MQKDMTDKIIKLETDIEFVKMKLGELATIIWKKSVISSHDELLKRNIASFHKFNKEKTTSDISKIKLDKSVEDLVSSIVCYQDENHNNKDIDLIYNDLITIRDLKTLNNSSIPEYKNPKKQLETFIEFYRCLFMDKNYMLSIPMFKIDDDICVETEYDMFYIEIGDDSVFLSDENIQAAIKSFDMYVDHDKLVVVISGSTLVKHNIADISEIIWKILWSGANDIEIIKIQPDN